MIKISIKEFLSDIDMDTITPANYRTIENLCHSDKLTSQSDKTAETIINFCYHAARKGLKVKFYKICEDSYYFHAAALAFYKSNLNNVRFYSSTCYSKSVENYQEMNEKTKEKIIKTTIKWNADGDLPDILVVFSSRMNAEEEAKVIHLMSRSYDSLFVRVFK